MNTINSVAKVFADHGWTITAIVFTVGYAMVLGLMIRKVFRDRALPDHQKPDPRPLFYLGQAYLAFIWPVPLFLVLEAIDFFDFPP